MMAVWAAQGANEIGMPLGPSIVLAGVRLTALSVATPIALLAAAWVLVARRDWRVLAVGAVIGPMLGFMVLIYVLHVVAPWLRYFILVIPLAILLVGLAIAPPVNPSMPPAQPGTARRRTARLAMALSTTLLLAVVVVSVPVSAAGMLEGRIAVEEARDVGALLRPNASSADRPGAALRTFAGEKAVADYVDTMELPRGSVLVDVFSGFAIVTQSRHAERYVITTDRDFERALADPVAFGVKYLLVPAAGGNAGLDAVNRAYPSIATQDTFATPVATFPALGTSSAWTLYELVQPAS
jgi:hypothetical protein